MHGIISAQVAPASGKGLDSSTSRSAAARDMENGEVEQAGDAGRSQERVGLLTPAGSGALHLSHAHSFSSYLVRARACSQLFACSHRY